MISHHKYYRMRYICFACFFLLFISEFKGQNLDSIIHIEPVYCIKKDTLYLGIKFNQINRDKKYRIVSLGNTTSKGIKSGCWAYFSAYRKQICIGRFKNGLKHGWWYWNADECNIKFKHGKEIKRLYHF